MNKQSVFAVTVGCVLLAPLVVLLAGERPTATGMETLRPTKGWAVATPASVGRDGKVLDGLDKDLAAGEVSLGGRFGERRCGTKVYERTDAGDDWQIYGSSEKERGPLNRRTRCR